MHSTGIYPLLVWTVTRTLPAASTSVFLWPVRTGEVASFVRHNAFLHWSVLQDVAFEDTSDNNQKKIWSEENVSEDFDMALHLQVWFFVLGLE
jgi:hypothetical protein